VTDTPLSLLDRLRQRPDQDSWQVSWRRLVELYTPLIRSTLGRFGVPDSDAEDILQEVLGVLVREVPAFEHNGRPGAFRCWLRTVVVHRLGAYWRAQKSRPVAGDSEFDTRLAELEDDSSDPSRQWDHEHDTLVARRLLELLEPEFTPSTWQAFRRQILDDARPADVAAELGITVNAVLIAKSRVLRRLREEGRGLVD
jgi:RNA polymerase sigma factor (sigma-70 family)